MSEFTDFFIEIINNYLRSEPIILLPFLIGIIIGIFYYVGYFYNFFVPKLPEKTFIKFEGIIFIFGYMLFFLWVSKIMIFPFMPNHELIFSGVILALTIYYLSNIKISAFFIIIILIIFKFTNYLYILTQFKNEITTTITILATLLYTTLIIISILIKCNAAENSLDYKSFYEIEWFSQYLSLESLRNIFEKTKTNKLSTLSYFIYFGKIYFEITKEITNNTKFKDVGRLLLNVIIFGPPKLIMLFVLTYLIMIIKELSLILGILTFSYILIALTLISMEKGISANIFKYAKIRLKVDSPPRNIEGRIKRLDQEGVQLLVKHSDNSTHWVYIPLESILNIELVKYIKSFGK